MYLQQLFQSDPLIISEHWHRVEVAWFSQQERQWTVLGILWTFTVFPSGLAQLKKHPLSNFEQLVWKFNLIFKFYKFHVQQCQAQMRWHSPSVHLTFTWRSSDVHLTFIWCSPDVHLMFTCHSPDLHLMFTSPSFDVHLTIIWPSPDPYQTLT